MQRDGSRILLSTTDLVIFNECEHATAPDRAALDDAGLRATQCEGDATAKLFQRKGHEFEARYLQHLQTTHHDLVEIRRQHRDSPALAAETLRAMRSGASMPSGLSWHGC